MLTKSGQNDLITVLYLAVAVGRLVRPSCTLRSIAAGDTDRASCSIELPFTAGVYRKRGKVRAACCLQCFDTWQNSWQFWLVYLCIPFKFTAQVAQPAASSLRSCWPPAVSILLLLLQLLADLTLHVLSSDKRQEKQRFFLSILGWLCCVVNICVLLLFFILWQNWKFCCILLFCFLKTSNFSFRNLCFLLSVLTSCIIS